MSPIALALAYFVVFGSIGLLIGQRRGRGFAGLVWGMVLGPVGWLLMFLLPSAASRKAGACPHCGGVLPVGQMSCNHCGNAVRWIQGRAFKPSRPVE